MIKRTILAITVTTLTLTGCSNIHNSKNIQQASIINDGTGEEWKYFLNEKPRNIFFTYNIKTGLVNISEVLDSSYDIDKKLVKTWDDNFYNWDKTNLLTDCISFPSEKPCSDKVYDKNFNSMGPVSEGSLGPHRLSVFVIPDRSNPILTTLGTGLGSAALITGCVLSLSKRCNPETTMGMFAQSKVDTIILNKILSAIKADLSNKFLSEYKHDFNTSQTAENYFAFSKKYANRDPQNLIDKLKNVLISKNEPINTFFAKYQLFTLTGSKKYFDAAQRLASTDDDKTTMEYISIQALNDKNRLFNIQSDIHGDEPHTERVGPDGMGEILFKGVADKWAALQHIHGPFSIKQSEQSPIDLKYGRYIVKVNAKLSFPTFESTRSDWVPDSDTTSRVKKEQNFECKILPPSYTCNGNIDFGEVRIATRTRGIMNGTTGTILLSNPQIDFSVTDIIKSDKQ